MKKLIKDLWKKIRSCPEMIMLIVSTSITVIVAIVLFVIIAKVAPGWALYLNHREFMCRMNFLMEVMVITGTQLLTVVFIVLFEMNIITPVVRKNKKKKGNK